MVNYVLKKMLPRPVREYGAGYLRLRRMNPGRAKSEILRKGVIIRAGRGEDRREDYVRQLSQMACRLRFSTDGYYVYPFDPLAIRLLPRGITGICSVTADFGKILKSDLNALRRETEVCADRRFAAAEAGVIDAVKRLSERVASRLSQAASGRTRTLRAYFPATLYRAPESLDEAVQKLLFYNALFWQAGHRHIGLGRLDKILHEYYERDAASGRLSRLEAKELLRQMILTLGRDTLAKSVCLAGDTGQYILLGGVDDDGETVQNDLTHMFLELFTELDIPDPKLILRVNAATNDEVWRGAVRCVSTGCGSPLLMNEGPVMENMARFGYDAKDVVQAGTSACWEPLVIGKSFDQNNPFRSASPLKALNGLLLAGREEYPSFGALLAAYKEAFAEELKSVVRDIEFDCSPLFSLFFDDCIRREKDFTQGGAVYAYHGAQVVGLPNAVNALLNIEELVFRRGLYTLGECREAMRSDFVGHEGLRAALLAGERKYGSTDEGVVALTNELMRFAGGVMSSCTCNGERIKVGFSSPNYISSAETVGASLDGRKAGDPFAVHISPVSSSIDIPEIIDFASQLDYGGNRINGNVVDFILPPSYVKEPEKLMAILKNGCEKGIFELQLNVLDRRTLADAKAHPEKYPNLIVRVWGFSAYFNDLPEAFKDNLIRRAEAYATA